MYSALKKGGHRLYDLARKGIVVEREARPVTVYNLELNLTNTDICKLPNFQLDIESSGGFYVRTLIVELAASLGCAAHMTGLVLFEGQLGYRLAQARLAERRGGRKENKKTLKYK
eukprot:gene21560-27598_t